MQESTWSHPLPVWVLIALLFFIGVGAVISGAMLFSAPDGRLLQMSAEILAGTLFSNYLIPGLILFLFVGVFPIFTGYSLLRQPPWAWPDVLNPFKTIRWAWTASWTAGVIMLIWIAVETLLLGLISFLQPVIAVYGAIIILLTLLPTTRKHYRKY